MRFNASFLRANVPFRDLLFVIPFIGKGKKFADSLSCVIPRRCLCDLLTFVDAIFPLLPSADFKISRKCCGREEGK
jgi:hypothetical protein